jgi:hypothetical protein
MKRIKALLALSLVPLLRPTAAANADEHGIAVADKGSTCMTFMHPAPYPRLDHEQLTYRHTGRDYRLTDIHGKVIKDLLA